MKRKSVAVLLAALLAMGSAQAPVWASEGESAAAALAAGFANPDSSYRPGVRWWWPGGAVEEETLNSEIDYLAEKGIGYVEINPFYVSTILEDDEEKVKSIYTPDFYKLLDTAITYCEEKGITVDLNMGSGWNANSPDVTCEESMGNMALGRMTVTGTQAKEALEIPAAERSLFYTGDGAKGEWQDDAVKLQGVLVAEITDEAGTDFVEGEGTFGPKPSYEEVYDAEGNVTKSYDTQIVLNAQNSYFISVDDAQFENGNLVLGSEISDALAEDKNYEIIAMYYVPSGGKGIDCAVPEWYTVDHMDAAKVADYMNDWLGNENLSAILEKHSNIRAVFNDSYEFYSDIYYSENIAELAADAENNGLGYDFSKYLPTIYKQYSAAPFYMGLGTTDTYLTYTTDADEKSRIQYDYNLLVNQRFQEGMAAFQESAEENGLLYRQEAYNPPIDTIGSAEYIDIPESEQADELSLLRTSSGAHLYGKNLVTCEQYTLGRTPLANTLEQFKIGYDVMATSGINNFFYHGMMYGYGVDTEEYGELGWAPFPSTGMNFSERNTLSEYFDEMNEYATRVNYLMQQGDASKDVAYYMPFNSSLSLTDAVNTMNSNGIAWDAINDDSIVSDDTTVVDGQIFVNDGAMVYDAIVIEAEKVPVATMEKLASLAEEGAAIIFYGTAPSKQPGYQDGNYAQADALTAEAAAAILECENGALAENAESFAQLLKEKTSPQVSYETNDQVRFARRTLEDGSELVYVRNIGETENTITLQVAETYTNCYWLDQSTGKIYAAEKAADNTITITMDASVDNLTGMSGDGPRSMSLALLCTTADAGIEVSEGLPAAIDQTEAAATAEVTFDTLTVGETVYTENIIGKWNSDDFQEGALKNSDETGVYDGSFTLDGKEDGQKVYLTLDSIYGAISVSVNGQEAGNILYAPYELDITDLAQDGENTITLKVTPRKFNEIHTDLSTEELIDTGLDSNVSVEIR